MAGALVAIERGVIDHPHLHAGNVGARLSDLAHLGTHLDTKEAGLVVCQPVTKDVSTGNNLARKQSHSAPAEGTATQSGDDNLMRWKIIAVNSIIVLLVGVLCFALLRASF